jgi:hypothetical protein
MGSLEEGIKRDASLTSAMRPCRLRLTLTLLQAAAHLRSKESVPLYTLFESDDKGKARESPRSASKGQGDAILLQVHHRERQSTDAEFEKGPARHRRPLWSTLDSLLRSG